MTVGFNCHEQYLRECCHSLGSYQLVAILEGLEGRTKARAVISLGIIFRPEVNCCRWVKRVLLTSLAFWALFCRKYSFTRSNPNSVPSHSASATPRETSKRAAPGGRATILASQTA